MHDNEHTLSPRTCISPNGSFIWGYHDPTFDVDNLRTETTTSSLGTRPDGSYVLNSQNFPQGTIDVAEASRIYEIPNAFSFRGTTYIDSSWAASRKKDPSTICIRAAENESFRDWLTIQLGSNHSKQTMVDAYASLPGPVLLSLATSSQDPEELTILAGLSCSMTLDDQGDLLCLQFDDKGTMPIIHHHDLYEAVANNPFLPDRFKRAMVLVPGIQGDSEIVGTYLSTDSTTHIHEYLRRNSYVPWGHYAANFAEDSVRYSLDQLSLQDMQGLRHLYYQRIYARLARELSRPNQGPYVTPEQMETVRIELLQELQKNPANLSFTSSLWGWNFGFDFAPSGYRLHASHQQVHQQNSLIPASVMSVHGQPISSFGCGDMIAETMDSYHKATGRSLFDDFLTCLGNNTRTDVPSEKASLILYEDAHVLLFVPKAQCSQWELQIMTKEPVGNVLETNTHCRQALDKALLLGVKTLWNMGARMITSIEYPKRFHKLASDQRMIYSLLPKLPWSPGAFSEAQLRFISGHYPEDFARACREKMPKL